MKTGSGRVNMKDKILFVDDNPSILSGLKRKLMGEYEITTALGPEQGLKAIEKFGPFAVIVSDYQMPVMNGIQFLEKARESAPDSVRMILTGQAALDVAINAVNKGEIFKFLTKPCLTEVLVDTLNSGIKYYKLVQAERDLLEKTFKSSIEVLTDILTLVSPAAFGRASRVERTMSKLAHKLDIEAPWEFEVGAMLSQIGCVTIPSDIVDKLYCGDSLDESEEKMYRTHPQLGHDLIAGIPRLENVADMILYQNKNMDGSGFPNDDVSGNDIPLAARALHIALDFDTLLASGISTEQAFKQLKQKSRLYDVEILNAFTSSVRIYQEKFVKFDELELGMILSTDLLTNTGSTIIVQGTKLTPSSMARLKNIHVTKGIVEPIRVLAVPDADEDE
ncbi:response regulator [bacterium]|nr:response regulator [bacterium]